MLSAAIFIIILIAVSGVIAYTGDLLGRRMGKRRLTVLGMRPRHTAIVITTVTGMLIAALALGTMLAINRQVRWALVRGQAILAQNYQLSKTNRSLRSRNQQLAAAQSKTERKLRASNESLDKLAGQMADMRKELEATRQQIQKEQARLIQTRARLSNAQTQLKRAEAQAFKVGRELIATSIGYEGLRAGYESLRAKPIIFSSDEEIVRIVVNPSPSVAVMRSRIIEVLERASAAALRAGAKAGKNGRAVEIVTKRVSLEGASGGPKVKTYGESQSIGFLAEVLSKASMPVVIQVVAVGNAAENEQVSVELRPFNNRLIFTKGQPIAEVTLNSGAERGELLNELARFLLRDVRRSATRAGVMPTSNPREREKLFGEIGAEQLLDVIDSVKRRSGIVKVTAVAANDVYAAGPLPLEFTVSGV